MIPLSFGRILYHRYDEFHPRYAEIPPETVPEQRQKGMKNFTVTVQMERDRLQQGRKNVPVEVYEFTPVHSPKAPDGVDFLVYERLVVSGKRDIQKVSRRLAVAAQQGEAAVRDAVQLLSKKAHGFCDHTYQPSLPGEKAPELFDAILQMRAALGLGQPSRVIIYPAGRKLLTSDQIRALKHPALPAATERKRLPKS